jgi:IclR family transcriptional regulator, KDG regulon repressor
MADATLSTVRNAAHLLAAFLPREEELGVTELARRLGLAKSSVHRLLSTLLGEGLVERNPHTGHYRLGVRLIELGDAARSRLGLSRVALPLLTDLRDQLGESVRLSVAHQSDVVVIERLDGTTAPRLPSEGPRRLPLYCSAEGKVLLAARTDTELADYLARTPFMRLTERTVTDPARLRTELIRVRRRGWAESVNEWRSGVAALAAPIRDDLGEVVAALTVYAPPNRFRVLARARLAALVVESARTLSRRLGWPTEDAMS